MGRRSSSTSDLKSRKKNKDRSKKSSRKSSLEKPAKKGTKKNKMTKREERTKRRSSTSVSSSSGSSSSSSSSSTSSSSSSSSASDSDDSYSATREKRKKSRQATTSRKAKSSKGGKRDRKKISMNSSSMSSSSSNSSGSLSEKLPTSYLSNPGAPVPVALNSSNTSAIVSKSGDSSVNTSSVNNSTTALLGPRSFEKLKSLGEGNCAKVFLVRKKGTDELYAMKVVSKEDMVARGKVKRVMTEKEILAHVDHPFIVRLYDTFQSKGKLYFILDYCAGGEFFEMLRKLPKGALPENDAKFYAAEVLLALEYLHTMGYIYRDLKPENILLHANGHVMLSDFDLSKSLDEKVGGTAGCHPEKPRYLDSSRRLDSNHQPRVDTEQRLKRCNSFVGTEEYISPEILAKGGYGSSVDWWTFGILIYEMLYGVTPFKGEDREETFDNVKKGKFDFPSSPPVSRECKDLIKGLLQPNPEKRLDAAALKAHPWFKGVHFALIRNVTPPIIPEATLSDIPKEVLLDNRVPYTRASLVNEDEDSGGSLVLPDNDANPGSSTNPFNHFSISMHRAAPDSPGLGASSLRNGSNGTISHTSSHHHPYTSSGDEAHNGQIHHSASSREKLARSSGSVTQLFPGHTPHPIIQRKPSSQAALPARIMSGNLESVASAK